ncbi:uncharacterized protein [Aegilops tauschii subsp. strangulata]|uniref:uncharacterized protein n=1 Tax=Aegilops tauschii subsp. strangulata TaxID=200361 RepID=UPI003CC88E4C
MSVARSSSGYLFVDPFANAFLFHAFYEAGAPLTATPADTPLLLWLQGDPGCSDLVSDLFELGPYLADAPDDSTLSRNPFTWTSPPSTRTTSPRPFFLSGESYAGKYVLAAGAAVVPWCPRTGSSRRRRRVPLQHAADPALELDEADIIWGGAAPAGTRLGGPCRRPRPPGPPSRAPRRHGMSPVAHIFAANPDDAGVAGDHLRGVAIGNGLMHPVAQVAMGLVNAPCQRAAAAGDGGGGAH